MSSRRLYQQSAIVSSSSTVSASGISPQNDHVSSLVIGSGHVFGTAVGAPLLRESRTHRNTAGIDRNDRNRKLSISHN
jgi:hypothetical protein